MFDDQVVNRYVFTHGVAQASLPATERAGTPVLPEIPPNCEPLDKVRGYCIVWLDDTPLPPVAPTGVGFLAGSHPNGIGRGNPPWLPQAAFLASGRPEAGTGACPYGKNLSL